MLTRCLCPLLSLLTALSVFACGDDDGGNTGGSDAMMDSALSDGGVDSGTEAGAQDAALEDGSIDGGDGSTPERCAVIQKVDGDGDGTYDRITKVVQWIEGGNKHIAVFDVDSDADGTYEEREISIRESLDIASLGPRLEQRFINLETNEERVRISMEYDAQGRRSRQTYDLDYNGVANSVRTWTYHDNGVVAEDTSYSDPDQDGTFDGFSRRINDTQGRPLRNEFDDAETPDENGDEIDRWETWEYDGITIKHSEFDLNGLIRYDENDFDEQGRWYRQAESPNGDTDFEDDRDSITIFTWDGNTRTGRGDGGDGAPDGEWEYEEVVTFDDDGRRIEGKSRLAGEEYKDFNRRSYDSEGRLLKEEWDEDGDGTYEISETYTYSAYGDETSFTRMDNEGTFTLRSAHYEYDASGNMTLCEEDRDGDETLEEVRSWTYDDQSRLTKYTRDDRTDGSDALDITDYEYICPVEVEL